MNTKKTILMALMGLEIGGAETHVVELSKELKKQGYNIIVASNGGVYEKELLEAGIVHYNVPMHQRNIFKIFKSYHLLKNIIIKENVDIVNAHARIPGFICGLLYKKLDFTFVASTHGVYSTKMGLKYLTNWGQKVIAVSEDIKTYLMDCYNVKEEDIFITINGIDTNKFSPNTSNFRIKKELSIKDNDKVIVHVSRLDEGGSATAAEILINSVYDLYKKIDNIKIVIAGGGNLFDSLKLKADKVNKEIGKKCIIMLGARTDINEILMAADLFVGVSRAALEAMAAEKVTILAGYAGYMGIFNSEKFSDARDNNFCCRGFSETNVESLVKDILYFFNNMSFEEKQKIAKYGREVIIEHYSVNRMAKDCLLAYDSAIKQTNSKGYNIIISGYYGFNNSGDEAILLSMYKNIKRMGDNINVTVLSKKPDETKSKYGVDVVYRFSIKEVFKTLKNCDVLLSGGGSLLQDSTSTRSLMYYLSIILLAKIMGKKVMLYANGIGPVSKNFNRQIVKTVINKADLITLREGYSYEELKSIGVNTKSFVTADPVFTLDSISKDKALKLITKENIPLDKSFIGVSVRNVKNWKNEDEFINEIAYICDMIYEKYNKNIIFIAMQVPNDINISEKVQKRMKNPSYILKKSYSPYEIIGIIGCMSFIISMRLHTLIFAAKQKVPLLGFIYDPKIEYYLQKLHMPSGGNINNFDMDKTISIIDDMINNSDKYKNILEKYSRELEEAAHNNEKYLMKLLKK